MKGVIAFLDNVQRGARSQLFADGTQQREVGERIACPLEEKHRHIYLCRAEHLAKVNVPMLFLEGTRDTLADLTLLRPICEKLGSRATLHIIHEGDHSFHLLQNAGKT